MPFKLWHECWKLHLLNSKDQQIENDLETDRCIDIYANMLISDEQQFHREKNSKIYQMQRCKCQTYAWLFMWMLWMLVRQRVNVFVLHRRGQRPRLRSPGCCVIEPGSFVFPSSVHPAMTASTPDTFKSYTSLELPWWLTMAMAQEQRPLRVQTQLAVNSHNIRHQVSVFEVEVLPLLPMIFIIWLMEESCFYFNLWLTVALVESCTNTHALSNTLGGRGTEMTAKFKVSPASVCVSPQRIAKWPYETPV